MGKALGGKGSQQGKGGGGKDLREEREKIWGQKPQGGKGRNDLNRERGGKDLREEREKIWGKKGQQGKGGKIQGRKRQKLSGGERP